MLTLGRHQVAHTPPLDVAGLSALAFIESISLRTRLSCIIAQFFVALYV